MKELRDELRKQSDKKKAKILQRFFKTGKGEYGEGDVFLGLTVPRQREIAKKFGGDLSVEHIEKLMSSKIHEERLIGLLILVERYKGDKKFVFDSYLKFAKMGRINNWDLVDLSAPKIVGDYLLDRDRKILYRLCKKGLWERRIAIISTFAFIRKNEFKDTLKISELLLRDDRDLIHKAVGWMLREIGKRDRSVLEKFLKRHYRKMPRTMLRYAIERFPEGLRKRFLRGEV